MIMTETFEMVQDKALKQKLQCPMGKVGCPLCYNVVDSWNSQGKIPSHADQFCDEMLNGGWKGMYQTLTGKTFNAMKEKTQCVAISAGVKEMVHQGCSLPTCAPETACATFC